MKLKRLLLSILTASLLTGCSVKTVENTIAQKDFNTSGTNETVKHQKPELTVDYIDVGQGDAELLRSSGETMLIDTGTPESGTAIRLFLKKHGVEKLDYLVLTHPDADHIGGAASVITNVPIDHVLMPEYKKDNRTYEGVIDALNYKYLKPEIPVAGDVFTLGSCEVKILGPINHYDDPNNNSIVMKVTCGQNKFMFVGDAEEEELNDITAKFGDELDSDVYKVGHHGSHNSSSEGFIRRVTPLYSVVSCGEGNSYGHPHAEALIRLRQASSNLFRTDKQGLITISSDGTNIICDPSPCNDWTPGENTGNSQPLTKNESNDVVAESGTTGQYVLNTNTKKFHINTCSSVKDMAEKNKKLSNQTKEEIISAGYKPCKKCNP